MSATETATRGRQIGTKVGRSVVALQWADRCPSVQVRGGQPPAATIPDFMARQRHRGKKQPQAGRARDQFERLHRQLTERDEYLLHALAHHRALTTEQVTRLAFGSATTARHRLAKLRQLGLIRSFQRRTGGLGLASAVHHLDRMGAAWLSPDCDARSVQGWSAHRAASLSSSRQLRHLLGLNSAVIAHAAAVLHDPTAPQLREWWSEADCKRWCGWIVEPDARLIWGAGNDELEVLLEYDRGTMEHARLREKLDRYAALERDRRKRCWVLMVFPSAERESNFHTHVRDADGQHGAVLVPVATTHMRADELTPPMWRVLNGDQRRWPLVELRQLAPTTEPLAATEPSHEWKYRVPTT